MTCFRRLWLERLVGGLIAVALVYPEPTFAEGQSIQDLLNSVDATLKGSPKKSNSDGNSKSGSRATEKRARPKTLEASGPSAEADTEAAKKSLSTPQVFEIPTNVSIARSKPSPSKNRVHLGVLRRQHLGGGELEKDDDRFNVKIGQSVMGTAVGADREFWSWGPGDQAPQFFAYLGAMVEVYRGNVAIDRVGIYNETFNSDVTWVDWFVKTDVRWKLYQDFYIDSFLGFGGETISQTGRGVTDSASGGFATDKTGLGLSYGAIEDFEISMALHRVGGLIARGDQAPRATAASVQLTARL